MTEIVNTQSCIPEFALGIKTYHHFTVDTSSGTVSGEYKHVGWTGIIPGSGNLNRTVSLSPSGCDLIVEMDGWAKTLANPLFASN